MFVVDGESKSKLCMLTETSRKATVIVKLIQEKSREGRRVGQNRRVNLLSEM